MAIDAALGRLGIRSGVCTSSTRPTNPYSGQLIYETDTNRTLVYDNAAWVVVADNQVLSIDSTNGRVGIGTTSPGAALDVSGGIFVSENITGSGDFYISNGSGEGLYASQSNNEVQLNTGGVSRVTVSSTGNVSTTGDLTVGAGTSRATLIINDIDGARYLVETGGYDLSFNKNVSGTSWVTALKINGSGAADNIPIVSKPTSPAFKAYSTSGDYTSGVLPYPNVVYNIGNHYNPSLSRFVAPISGVYHFHAQVYRRLASEDDEVAMRVNGSDVTRSRTRTVGAAGYANNHITELLYLNPSDYVDVDVAVNGAHLNSGLFSFQGHFVG